jgi:hypothetical protein
LRKLNEGAKLPIPLEVVGYRSQIVAALIGAEFQAYRVMYKLRIG